MTPLGEDAYQRGAGERCGRTWAPTVPEHRDEHGEGDQANDDAQDSVTELDDAMSAHLRGGHEGVGCASGPGRAPQPGAG